MNAHRTIECLMLEKTLEAIQVQPCCHEEGCYSPYQDAQVPIQPDIECRQGWGILTKRLRNKKCVCENQHQELHNFLSPKAELRPSAICFYSLLYWAECQAQFVGFLRIIYWLSVFTWMRIAVCLLADVILSIQIIFKIFI